MSIQPLPGDVVAQIKSSAVITSLNGVVDGLLRNSLDAGATKINISIDYSRGNCSVEDNGLGIPPACFREDGGLGKLYYTSRYPPDPDFHGRHGQFLASLAALSLLSISSHHHEHRSHNALTIHNSRVVARNTPALPEERFLVFPSGTRVIVRNLFGSMPVRVKQRATEVERLGTAKTLDQLIHVITSLLLAWPNQVNLSVRDAVSRRTVTLRTSGMTSQVQDRRNSANVLVLRASSLFAQASLTDEQDSKSWVPVGASVPGVSVSGCFCLVPVATRRVQFMSLGIQPLSNENDSNILYEEVNRVFANSGFGVIEEATLNEKQPRRKEGFTLKELKPRKGIDRWPMFFLRITMAGQEGSLNADDFLDERQQDLSIITDLLQVIAYEFLKKHHFRPKSINAFGRLKSPRGSSDEASGLKRSVSSSSSQTASSCNKKHTPSGLARSTVSSSRGSSSSCQIEEGSASPFTSWSRVNSGSTPELLPSKSSSSLILSAGKTVKSASISTQDGEIVPWAQNPLFDRAGKLIRKPFEDVEPPPSSNNHLASRGPSRQSSLPSIPGSSNTDNYMEWVNPITNIRTLINPRTGFMIRSHSVPGTKPRDTPKPRPKGSPSRTSAAAPKITAFKPVEAPIPRVPELYESMEHGAHHSCNHHSTGGVNVETGNGGALMTLQGRISRDALRTATVIAQVDKKFIFVKLAPTEAEKFSPRPDVDRSVLVLVDQHAADERVRVEDLMKSYFTIAPSSGGTKSNEIIAQTQSLQRPLRFDLSKQDGTLLLRYKLHFEYWGIFYEVFAGEDHSTRFTVEVQSLPPSILERCRLEPRVLIELLRKEVWRLNDNLGLGLSTSHGIRGAQEEGERDWVARFHDCPEGILELLNSRSCRSAIMFNDELSLEECKSLVLQLAECAFPFQCAHGRPSMVPLVDLGAGLVPRSDLTIPDDFGRSRGEGNQGKNNLWSELKGWRRDKIREGR
ncbi:putative MLH3 protein [Sordaria sp. MPI-SDFR-AT-0083]|nr:putative MLH3 protein [Sordaria sp. MPI-SDFR-AT-0083]